ncbi:transglycosylase SLT domain-containing protein [Chromobacterium sp. LK11]|uniref:transglycosylase SLT domain-containing protein n=1 Tax=Chromobacterium sp. LK11 TaxID=1628212 RepID=UPI001E63E218|nr:transglycosylase SLT domain-containing protein [Chromobacterium sp. LK11]
MNWSMRCKGLLPLLAACALLVDGAQAANCWREAGARHRVDPLLLYSIAKVESSLNPRAVNYNKDGSHDIGLMQINSLHLPALAQRGISRQRLLDEPCLSVQVGASILADFIARYGYTWRAVGAYNAGGAAAREGARKRYVDKVWRQYLQLRAEREARG